MSTIKKNILDVEAGIIVHQVNCMGVMGAGLALQIKNKWPEVYYTYMEYIVPKKYWNEHADELGEVLYVAVNSQLLVASLFGQVGYGVGVHTVSAAHDAAWPGINELSMSTGLTVYAPWMIGCGLGGGNWTEIRAIAETHCQDVIWCQL